jgi:hypothetical protein
LGGFGSFPICPAREAHSVKGGPPSNRKGKAVPHPAGAPPTRGNPVSERPRRCTTSASAPCSGSKYKSSVDSRSSWRRALASCAVTDPAPLAFRQEFGRPAPLKGPLATRLSQEFSPGRGASRAPRGGRNYSSRSGPTGDAAHQASGRRSGQGSLRHIYARSADALGMEMPVAPPCRHQGRRAAADLAPVPLLRRSDQSLSPHIDQHVFQSLHFFESTAGAERHAGQRVVRDRNRQSRSVPQYQIEIAE